MKNIKQKEFRMIRNLKFFIVFVFFLDFVLSVFAQDKVVKGLIRDTKGNPLPGVTILVKGSKSGYGVVSDLNGNYSIKAKVGDVLLYSHIGLSPKEYKVNNRNAVMDIVMEELAHQLDDVVVMGYGSAKKVATTLGSVVKVSGEAFQDKPVASALDALQGKVAGLQVLATSGEPSDMGTIRLHGASSLFSNSNPLIILDGSPISTSAMLYLNPQDFESVTVLKDASATSIYGTRAANGVIYIKTKKGNLGEKGSISMSSQYGFSSLANRDFYNAMMNREEYRRYVLEFGADPLGVDNFLAENPHDTRWNEIFFRDKRPTTQINVSTNGGTEKTTYFVSGGYYKQQGLMHRSGFERYNFRSNLTSQVNDWFKLGLNLSAGYS